MGDAFSRPEEIQRMCSEIFPEYLQKFRVITQMYASTPYGNNKRERKTYQKVDEPDKEYTNEHGDEEIQVDTFPSYSV